MRLTAFDPTEATRAAATWLKPAYFWRPTERACDCAASLLALVISLVREVILFVVTTYAATASTSTASTPITTYAPPAPLPVAWYGRAFCGRRLTGLTTTLPARGRRPPCGGAGPRRSARRPPRARRAGRRRPRAGGSGPTAPRPGPRTSSRGRTAEPRQRGGRRAAPCRSRSRAESPRRAWRRRGRPPRPSPWRAGA